jgi:hypothetical protein
VLPSVSILPDGKESPTDITAGVDTLSGVSLAARESLSLVHSIVPDQVRCSGGFTDFTEEGFLDVCSNGGVSRVPALVALPHQLPHQCKALLGMPAIRDLGVRLDQQKLQQGAPLICHLGEKSLRSWWCWRQARTSGYCIT